MIVGQFQRATLLEDLAKVQAPADEIKQYLSITTLQTKGLKRHLQESNAPEFRPRVVDSDKEDEPEDTINAIRGSKKKRLTLLREESKRDSNADPNVVGLTVSLLLIRQCCLANFLFSCKYFSAAFVFQDSSESDDETSANEDDEQTVAEPEAPTEISPPVAEAKISNEKPAAKIVSAAAGVASETAEPKPKPKPKTTINPNDRVPAVFVAVDRKPEIQEARLKLPVLAEEQSIVEAINDNPVVIITGETGSGEFCRSEK